MNNDDLDDAYRLWLMWFRKSTNSLNLPKPEPYSFTTEIEEVWDTFMDNLEDIGGSIADGFSGNSGILGVLKAIATAILSPFLAAAAAIDALIGTITTVTVAPIRFFISLAYDELYNAYMNLHQAVVLNGFGFPYNYQLSNYLINHVFNSGFQDVLGNNAASISNIYPTKKFNKVQGLECESHLIYPIHGIATLEDDNSTGAPNSYYGSYFSKFMFGSINFNRDHYEDFKKFVEKNNLDTASTTNNKFINQFSVASSDVFGSAVNFSCILYQDYLNNKKISDFNLDADRGIGYKAWRKVAHFDDINDAAKPHVAVSTDNLVHNIQTDILQENNMIR